MKFLYLAHRIPYPPDKGDKIRTYHEVKCLAAAGEVYLVALVDDPQDLAHADELRRLCREVHLVPFTPRLKKVLALKGLLCGRPLTVEYFFERDMQTRVNALLARHKFTAVCCFSVQMAEYFFRAGLQANRGQGRNGTVVAVDFCDVDSAKWEAYAQISSWPLSWLYRREGRLLAAYEQRVAAAYDYSIFVSAREAALFHRRYPGGAGASLVIQNGVDLEYYRPGRNALPEPGAAPELIFVGAMDYYANIDGAVWFAERIWPLIRARFPEAKFTIVGAKPGPQVQRLDNGCDILVTGYVPDVRPFYSRATVCVAPLRIARGIQNKILEAMAMARPVVCTPAAFEGIEATPGKDLLLAADESSFAGAVIDLLENAGLRDSLGGNARQAVERNYCWADALVRFRQLMTSAADKT